MLHCRCWPSGPGLLASCGESTFFSLYKGGGVLGEVVLATERCGWLSECPLA